MQESLDEPFDEDDEILSVTLVREDLRLLLVAATTYQIDARNQRLQLAIDRLAPFMRR